MTRDELFALAAGMHVDAKVTMGAKNRDYSTEKDALSNFHRSGLAGIITRMEDKLARITNFQTTGILNVKDESIKDTCLDLINYAILYYAYVSETKQNEKK